MVIRINWSPPVHGFNEACFQDHTVGLGVMVRSNSGMYKAGHSLCVVASLDAEAVEALAALEALQLMRQFEFDPVVMEGNSKNIISAL